MATTALSSSSQHRLAATPADVCHKRRRWRLPIGLVLASLVVGAVVVAGGGSTLLLARLAETQGRAALDEKAWLLLDRSTAAVTAELDAAVAAADLVADLTARAPLPLAAVLDAAYSRAPGLASIELHDLDGTSLRVEGPREAPVVAALDAGPQRHARAQLDLLRAAEPKDGFWETIPANKPAVWGQFEYIRPLWADGKLEGYVEVALDPGRLSVVLAALDDTAGQVSFVLLGDAAVVAHPSLAGVVAPPSQGAPLPGIDEVADPVLAAIWSARTQHEVDLVGGGLLRVGTAPSLDQRYVYIWRPIERGDAAPLIVGSHFPATSFGAAIEQIKQGVIVSGIVVALTLLAAVLAASRISRPLEELAAAARALGDLRLEEEPKLSSSRLREIDDAQTALRASWRGLRNFARYLPASIVRQLMLPNALGAARSERAEVSVLFTDIVDFTALTSRLEPQAVADLLNAHFQLVTDCIERTGGTVDKYIGDSVMAVWGAPLAQPDHARRACEAARAIAQEVRRANRLGDPPLRVRIGVLAGTAIVGEVGTDQRVNYTAVGRVVNEASRLQELGKEIDAAADVVALTTTETATAAGIAATLGPETPIRPRGGHEDLHVVRLV